MPFWGLDQKILSFHGALKSFEFDKIDCRAKAFPRQRDFNPGPEPQACPHQSINLPIPLSLNCLAPQIQAKLNAHVTSIDKI